MKNDFLYLLIIIVLSACTSTKNTSLKMPNTPVLADRMLWKITKTGQNDTTFLLGTFHLMCKEDIIFNDLISKKIQSSDKLYLEIDMDDPSMMMSMLTAFNMKEGKTLSDLVTPQEYTRIATFFKDSLGTPVDFLKNMKPFLLQSVLYPKLMNCRQVSGIEQEVMALAKIHNKDILGLETLQYQASIFDSVPYDVQAKAVVKMIDSLDKYRGEFAHMYQLYKNEKLQELGTLMDKEDEDMKDFMPMLLTNRNINWVNKLRDLLPNQSLFIAVGAGHLVGKTGLIELLRREGYSVEPAY